jgi:hypothetical protein
MVAQNTRRVMLSALWFCQVPAELERAEVGISVSGHMKGPWALTQEVG